MKCKALSIANDFNIPHRADCLFLVLSRNQERFNDFAVTVRNKPKFMPATIFVRLPPRMVQSDKWVQ